MCVELHVLLKLMAQQLCDNDADFGTLQVFCQPVLFTTCFPLSSSYT
jgi:hypothetical protein